MVTSVVVVIGRLLVVVNDSVVVSALSVVVDDASVDTSLTVVVGDSFEKSIVVEIHSSISVDQVPEVGTAGLEVTSGKLSWLHLKSRSQSFF